MDTLCNRAKYSQYNPEWILCIILIKSFLSKYSYPFEVKEYQHKVVISTISSSNLTHHYARNNVSQHHQKHVVPGNRVHFRSVIHSIVISNGYYIRVLQKFWFAQMAYECHNINNSWYGAGLTAGPWRSAWGRRRASAGSRCAGGGASWPIRGEYCGSTNHSSPHDPGVKDGGQAEQQRHGQHQHDGQQHLTNQRWALWSRDPASLRQSQLTVVLRTWRRSGFITTKYLQCKWNSEGLVETTFEVLKTIMYLLYRKFDSDPWSLLSCLASSVTVQRISAEYPAPIATIAITITSQR